jgi:exopolyphosphatase / guanosine-5'-triphosphate,3'-diphosphate pyrophosphatase
VLDRCAVLLRLAEDLERSRDQLVRGTRFTPMSPALKASGGRSHAERNGVAAAVGEIELRLIAEGESAVPRWAAARETELFARAFHTRLSVAG